MSNELANIQGATLEKVLIGGDLSTLSPAERVNYYMTVCNTLGLNPATKPFSYIVLNGKLTLYANRDCADQLRKRDSISVEITNREMMEGTYIVTARASVGDRSDESIGAVFVGNMMGQDLANAMMKTETKAKRRVTLSISGLGFLDETEVGDVATAVQVNVDDDGTIETKAIEPKATEAKNPKVTRPMPPETLAEAISKKAMLYRSNPKFREIWNSLSFKNAEGKERTARDKFVWEMSQLSGGDDNIRHEVSIYLFGTKSSKDIDEQNVVAALDWMGFWVKEATGEHLPGKYVQQEFDGIVQFLADEIKGNGDPVDLKFDDQPEEQF